MENPFELEEHTEEPSIVREISDNLIIYDILLMEADRVRNARREEFDLYYIDKHSGEFEKIAKAYSGSIANLSDQLFKKSRTRFFITFDKTFVVEEKLKPVALKILRHFARTMTYGNLLVGYSYEDIKNHFRIHPNYITSGVKQLLDLDCIRFSIHRNRRTYIINPIYYYKGSPTSLFHTIGKYSGYIRGNHKIRDEK